jgi:threonine synthase
MRCINLVPHDISPVALQQCLYYGSETYMFDGPWHESGKLVSALQQKFGWFNVGTLKEPYRVEGKKTMGYEMCEQLGWQLPEVLVYPTGGALGVVAIYKAFEELLELGWVSGKMPQAIIVQYEGCAPIVRAYDEAQARARPWLDIDTLPGGLKSATPSGDRVTLDWIRQTKGHGVAVSAAESLDAVRDLAIDEGLLVSAEVGAALAGLKKSLDQGIVKKDARIVLVATGSGLKATSILPSLPLPRLAGLGQFSASGEYRG